MTLFPTAGLLGDVVPLHGTLSHPTGARERASASPSCLSDSPCSSNVEGAGVRPESRRLGITKAIFCPVGQRTRKRKFRKTTKKDAKHPELQRLEEKKNPNDFSFRGLSASRGLTASALWIPEAFSYSCERLLPSTRDLRGAQDRRRKWRKMETLR